MKHISRFIGCFFLFLLIIGMFIIPQSSKASEPLIIGVLHSESFPYAAMMKNSFEMALEVINKEGGIKGRPLKLVYANDQGKPKPGEKAIIDLVEKSGAVMLVGGYQSSNTIFMARMAEKLDRPFLVCTAADDRTSLGELSPPVPSSSSCVRSSRPFAGLGRHSPLPASCGDTWTRGVGARNG